MSASKLYRRKFKTALFICILLISIFMPLLALVPRTVGLPPWWDDKWNFRKTITLNHTMVNSTLQNFPILIDITESDLKKAQSDGDDIVFIGSNNTRLNHEIELFNSDSGRLVAWVNIPQLSSTEDTILQMYYGNPSAPNQQNSSAVWDSNLTLVQHLEETGVTRFDSTLYGNNGTAYGSISKTAAGKIDGADVFDGVDDYIQVANSPSLNPSSAVTIELWMNLSSTGDFINLVNKGTWAQYYLRLGPQEGRTYFYVKFNDGTVATIEGSATGWKYNVWHYVVATLDTSASTIEVYVDGVRRLNGTFASGKSIIATTNPVRISDTTRRVKGSIDGVRISNIARSPAWIQTTYNMQKSPSDFCLVGLEEPRPGGPEAIFVSDETPTNSTIGVYTNPTLSVRVLELNGNAMNITFKEKVLNDWIDIKTYLNAYDGVYAANSTSMKSLGTTYYWSVYVTNGQNSTTKTYSFTTTTKILQQKWLAKTGYSGVSGVLAADVNGDGIDEVIHAGKGGVIVLKGTDGSVIWNFSDSGIGDHAQAQVADLNNDGVPEIVVSLEFPGGLLALHANNGSTYWRITGLGRGGIYSSPVIFDIDGNGYPTIFVGSEDVSKGLSGTGRISAVSYNGTILYQTFAWRPCSGGLSIADTDWDGEFELYMGDRHMYLNSTEYGDNNYGKGVQSYWAKNLTLRWYRPEIFCSSQIPMLADVNGDGVLDVIIGHMEGGVAVLNSTDGSAINMKLGITNDAPTHYQPAVYDIDGDGNLEFLMADPHDWTSDDLVVWDLIKWKVDARMYIGKDFYGPQVADVTGDGIMEIIACNYRSIFIIDRTYRVIDGILGLSGDIIQEGEIRNIDGISMLTGTLNYAVVQDIDGDGYNELIVSTQSGYIYAFYTPARRPNPRPRSEVQFYSEFRLGAAEYVQPQGGPAPITSSPNPPNHVNEVSVSLSKLSFTLTDYQHDPMNFTVATYPDIGSASVINAANGRYEILVDQTNLRYSTTFMWTVNATDGTHWTNVTYTFTTQTFSPWWNTSWQHRKAITIDHNMVPADLNNFPLLIDIKDSDLLSKAQDDGGDIVFTNNNGLKLSHEIELYDNGTGHLVAWIKIPLLSSTTDTKIYMYYGNPTIENQQNPSEVWGSNFVMVQHLEETGSTRFDSTPYGNNGTVYGGISKSVAGKIDGADMLGGIDDYIQVANSPSLNPSSAITIELWMNLSSTGDFINLVNKGTYSQYYLRLGTSTGNAYWYVKFSDGTSKPIEGFIGWTDNAWHYIVATLDTNAQTIKVYVDGVERLSGTFASGKSIIATTNPVRISDTTRRVKGSIDEVRISNIARSPAWIQTTYNNQKDPAAFYTINEEETIPEFPVVYAPSPPDKAINISPSLSEISFNITDCQGDLMNYTVTTYPNIGSDTKENVNSGRFALDVSSLQYSATYSWTISVTDGTYWTNVTYTFTTYPSEPPTQEEPVLILNEGGNIICYNQTTYDPDGDKVTNIYNWYKNHTSITNLLLSFNTNSSTTTKDYSGYNNNGIIVRDVTWTSNGKVGGAYNFNRGFIQIPGSNALDGGGQWSEITVEHWIYLTAYPQSGTSARTIARIPSYEIGISGNKLFAGVWIDTKTPSKSGYSKVTWDTPLQTNTWYHVTFTYKNGTGLALYVNGTAVATGTPWIWGNIQPSGPNPLYIGWFDYFKGLIDEVRIYPKSLSPQQIYQRYNETKDGLSNSSAIRSQETKIGEVWKCEVTPNDAYQDGAAKFSNSITIGLTDNFNDNSTNVDIWKTLQKNNGTVSETNSRVECNVPSGPGTAGYITKASYELSNCFIQVDVSNQYLCETALAITLDGINDHFWYSDNFYVIEKHRWALDVDNLTLKVKKRINGGDRIYLYEGNWTSPAGSLAIKIENGIIYFYEDGILRYFEPFELASYKCYIHFEANTWDTNYNGTDYFDNFIFINNKPSAKDLTITPTIPKTNDDLTASYTFFDPDDDPENGTEIRWYKNDALQPELNDTLIVPYDLTTKGEVWHFTVTPSDGKEFGESYTSPHVLIQNSPPTIDSFTPQSTTLEINEMEKIDFTHTSSDIDNDTLTYSWLLNGTEQSIAQNWTYTSDYDSSGTHNITLIVFDGELTDSQQWTVTVNNINRSPTIDLHYPPTDPTINEGESQEFNITYSDLDGDVITVQWYLNGTPRVSTVLYIFEANYTSAGTYNVTVVISDGLDEDSHEWTLTVLDVNQPPEITSWYPLTDPDPIYVGDSLEFNITCSDPDGDSLTIQWYVNETLQITWTGNTSILFEPVQAGTYIIKVVVSDGQDETSHQWTLTVQQP